MCYIVVVTSIVKSCAFFYYCTFAEKSIHIIDPNEGDVHAKKIQTKNGESNEQRIKVKSHTIKREWGKNCATSDIEETDDWLAQG